MNLHKQNFVCWPSVGPQDIKQTYIHTYNVLLGSLLYQLQADMFYNLDHQQISMRTVPLIKHRPSYFFGALSSNALNI